MFYFDPNKFPHLSKEEIAIYEFHESLHRKFKMLRLMDSYKLEHYIEKYWMKPKDLSINPNMCIESELDFWIPVYSIPKNERPHTFDSHIKIKIKSVCSACNRKISINNKYPGSSNSTTDLENWCQHYDYYSEVWANRIIEQSKITDPVNDGCRCKKCQDWYPMAEPNQSDGTLICWSCRQS